MQCSCYYINAIGANSGVVGKLQTHARRLGLSADIVVDDRTARIHQARDNVAVDARLSRALLVVDADPVQRVELFGVLLKKLTLISIIFLPLNLIASIGGMSEFSMMTQGIDWRITYSLFGLAMVAARVGQLAHARAGARAAATPREGRRTGTRAILFSNLIEH